MGNVRDATQPVMEIIRDLKENLYHLEHGVDLVGELKSKIEHNKRMIAIADGAVSFKVVPVPPYITNDVEEYIFGPDTRIRDTIVEFLKAENSKLDVVIYDALNKVNELSEIKRALS